MSLALLLNPGLAASTYFRVLRVFPMLVAFQTVTPSLVVVPAGSLTLLAFCPGMPGIVTPDRNAPHPCRSDRSRSRQHLGTHLMPCRASLSLFGDADFDDLIKWHECFSKRQSRLILFPAPFQFVLFLLPQILFGIAIASSLRCLRYSGVLTVVQGGAVTIEGIEPNSHKARISSKIGSQLWFCNRWPRY